MRTLARTLLAGLMACPILGFSQNVPLFQFSLYFEDSVGNKDSIVLGYDPSASSQNLNAQFGEIGLNTPFDSVFEVRAIHGDDSQKRTSKKLIEDADTSDACELAAYIKIVINAKFPPIKISYDSTLFTAGTCRNVVLSPEWNLFLLQEWWHTHEYYCMGSSSVFVEDFQHPVGWNFLFVEKEVEGQGLKQLPGLFFAMFYGQGPCNDPTFLAEKAVSGNDFRPLRPNPVSEYFSVQLPSGSEVQATVINVSGRVMVCPFTISGGIAQFDASNLLPGLYIVFLQEEQGRQAVYKFLKM